MRDKISHKYWQVDLEILGKVIQKDIPFLKITIVDIIDNLS
ncbi:MAG: HepT-like ribonuclease domain-containing protein [Microcystaceae cyanobacterium]